MRRVSEEYLMSKLWVEKGAIGSRILYVDRAGNGSSMASARHTAPLCE